MKFNAVVTFPSTFFAMQAEKRFSQSALTCKLIPSPRDLSSSCAVSLNFSGDLVERAKEILTSQNLTFDTLYLYGEDQVGHEVLKWAGS